MAVVDRSTAASTGCRVATGGKFFRTGTEKLWIKGVTYGTFRPGADGAGYRRDAVERDFARMAASGINTVRVYSAPPLWLLDAAAAHGLQVLIGLAWEQHLTFLDDPDRSVDIIQRVEADVRSCAGHPAVFAYAVGNEIPASIVRWYGAARIERWIERLCATVTRVDPSALTTYVNYPSTEYLRLPFLDFVAFNVYLERQDQLEAYLARLQNLAGDRPLVLAELGLDSRRNGLDAQAESLAWQLETAFTGGCAGVFVYAWTDEWHRGGADIDDWDFGLVTRERAPKPALSAVSAGFERAPFPPGTHWPRISVVVCTCNGARVLPDCLDGLAQLDYPDYEVILIDDGSTDSSAAIASEYQVTVISTPNQGLSAARTLGAEQATGEIVAYTDDDARPDPDWLRYLAWTYLTTDHAAVGGPNIAPDGDGPIAFCVANAPGGPVHVLLTDDIAEHVPGCNLSARRDRILEIGGFDPRFRAAGDDVDFCWRIQDRGWTVGFSPGAMVWHHRRNSVKAYWKQQQGYGKAEALLEAKWPERYNTMGHLSWAGRLYGAGWTRALRGQVGRIYHGTWGQAPFQQLYDGRPPLLAMLPLMPEWWLVVAALALVSLLGFAWTPLFFALPLLIVASAASIAQAWVSTADLSYPTGLGGFARSRLRLLTVGLHLIQPIARLRGRLRYGLSPWRRRGLGATTLPVPRTVSVWNEGWMAPDTRIGGIEQSLGASRTIVRRGGDYDRWDLELRGGLFGSARMLHTVEDHGAGQLARFRIWPICAVIPWLVTGLLVALAVIAFAQSARIAGGALLAGAVLLVLAASIDSGRAVKAMIAACGAEGRPV